MKWTNKLFITSVTVVAQLMGQTSADAVSYQTDCCDCCPCDDPCDFQMSIVKVIGIGVSALGLGTAAGLAGGVWSRDRILDGRKGLDGFDGRSGFQGRHGDTGEMGLQAPAARDGMDGTAGRVPPQSNVQAAFNGLNPLPGNTQPGMAGMAGMAGTAGTAGMAGTTGNDGITPLIPDPNVKPANPGRNGGELPPIPLMSGTRGGNAQRRCKTEQPLTVLFTSEEGGSWHGEVMDPTNLPHQAQPIDETRSSVVLDEVLLEGDYTISFVKQDDQPLTGEAVIFTEGQAEPVATFSVDNQTEESTSFSYHHQSTD